MYTLDIYIYNVRLYQVTPWMILKSINLTVVLTVINKQFQLMIYHELFRDYGSLKI